MIKRGLRLRSFFEDLVNYAYNEYRSLRSKRKGASKFVGLRIIGTSLKTLECLEYKNDLAPKDWDIIQWFYNILIDFEKYLRYLEDDNQLRTRKGGITIKYDGI